MQTALLHSTRTVPLLPGFASSLAGRTVAVEIPRPVKLRLRSPEKMRVSEWAAAHRTVAEGAHEGPWRHELAPHTVKIMDTYGLPWVREVWFCGVEQSGKTNAMLNCLGWAVDCDPGGIFYLMPTEETSSKILGGKMRPMLQRSPRLARYLSKRQDDTTLSRINLAHGVTIHPAWANSPASMATWAAKHCFGDEVDKYPALSGRESDPITLLKKRNRNYKGRFKRFFASTPAGMFIHKGMQACHQVWEFRVRCPDCGELIRMDAAHLVIPEGATAETVEQAGVEYACTCASVWDDEIRESAIRSGRWVCVKGEEHARPAKVGFHHRAWECLDIPLAEIAAAWLKSKAGDHAAKIAWANGYEAADFEPETVEAPALAALADRVENYAPVVPMNAAVLTGGADVQGDRIEIEVVAWGVGAESWGMENEVLWGDTSLPDVWEQLDVYSMKRFRHESGEELDISRIFVDSGFRSHMVYKFTGPRLSRGIFAIKGAKDHDAREVAGPTKQKYGGGVAHLFTLGTQKIKTTMFGYFGLAKPGPGYCHVPDTYRPEWFAGLQTEHLVTRNIAGRSVSTWEIIKQGLRNEPIDKRCYALAALMSMRIDLKGAVQELKEMAEKRNAENKPAERTRSRGSFVNRWKG